jgi:hypothetical protein
VLLENPLLLPRLVGHLRAIDLPLLQQSHLAPLRHVWRVDVATGLDAETRALATGRYAVDGGHVDAGAGVELKGRLSAIDLEMELGIGVVELAEELQRLRARVQRYFGGIGLDQEAVVDVGLVGAQNKGLVSLDLLVWPNVAMGDPGVVERYALIGRQLRNDPGDARAIGDVEVAGAGSQNRRSLLKHGGADGQIPHL